MELFIPKPKAMIKALSSFSTLCCIFLSFSLPAQTPCSSGSAGPYPCNNIDFLSHVDLGANNLNASWTSDIWGWTGTDGKEYALVGLRNGTSFVDVTDGANPIIIGKLPRHTSMVSDIWRDIKVINNYAYIVSEATGHGVQIFDLTRLTTATNLPVTFTEDGWIDMPGPNKAHNIVANELSEYIIPVGTNGMHGGGLTFYNVANNPTDPTLDGSYESAGYSHDAQCFFYRGPDLEHVGKEICIGFNESFVALTDVTDKNNPTSISTISYAGSEYCHQGWVTEDHKYILLNDEHDEAFNGHNTRTYIIDISDLENGFLKHTYTASTSSIDHNLYIKGPYAYLANYSSGLRVLDLSNLDSSPPTEVAFFDNHPTSNGASSDGAWSVYPYFKSGNMIMTNIDDDTYGGLHVIKPNLPHYVLEVQGQGVETICQGGTATYTFNATAYAGYSNLDNIEVSGNPIGTTATLSDNPISPIGTLTLSISNTETADLGNYNIMLSGTETPKNRVSVGLIITDDATGNLPPTELVSPEAGVGELPLILDFDWNAVTGATLYDLEISTDALFNNIVASAYNLSVTQHTITAGLEENSGYFWRVMAKDNQCSISLGFEARDFRTIVDPLPVELISFKADVKENNILLDWQTASEIGFAGFELQRSTAVGTAPFRKIAAYSPQATSDKDGFNYYQHLDQEVYPGQIYYYRLAMLDLDGTVQYSPVVSAELKAEKDNFQIYPNPVDKYLQILWNQEIGAEAVNVRIFDVSGQNIRSIDLKGSELKDGYSLNINDLADGIYLLSIISPGRELSKRFVKK